MLSLEELGSGPQEYPGGILYGILSRSEGGGGGPALGCHCDRTRAVCLKDPKVASGAMVKTFRFIRGLPSFALLPPDDREALLRHCWVHLFLLGLAQEGTALEVTPAPPSSILRQILLGPGPREEEQRPPTLAGVHRLRALMDNLWTLELSPKEYAYLKGVLLFNPAVPGLRALMLIKGLQRDAQRALGEAGRLLHPGDASRLGRVLLAASSIQSVSQRLVSQLLLRPVIDHDEALRSLTETLVSQ